MFILAGVFKFQSQDGMSVDPYWNQNLISITVCLRQAREILPDKSDKTAIEENNDDKFSQLMRSKAVHLLALFVIVYIGVEVTVGGIIFVIYMIVTSLITINQDGL